jgi:hypothetical protein
MEESQQPTWPHFRHSRSSTQVVPSRRHSSHALGVRGVGKSAAVNPFRCSHGLFMDFSFHDGRQSQEVPVQAILTIDLDKYKCIACN